MAAKGTKLAKARRTVSIVRRQMADERIQVGGGSTLGSATAAMLEDTRGGGFIGDTPISKHVAYGAAGVAAAFIAPKKLPMRALLGGIALGFWDAGVYVTTLEFKRRQDEPDTV